MKHLFYEDVYRQESNQELVDILLRKGWSECPAAPVIDPVTQTVHWNNDIKQWITEIIPKNIPTEIPLWAFRNVLRINNLKTNVENFINALPEPQKSLVLDQYEYGNVIVRTHPLVQSLGNQLGLSSDDIDNLFISASQLS